MWLLPLIAVVVVALAVGAASLFVSARPKAPRNEPVSVATSGNPLPEKSLPASDGAQTSSVATPSVAEVEVPNVVGKDLETGEMIMEAAGLRTVTRVVDTAAPGVAANAIVSQDPAPGFRADSSQVVTLVYQPRQTVGASSGRRTVVVIDPGHQSEPDLRPEPIGPGSSTTKARVSGGAKGVATGVPEYVRTLAVSLKLRSLLQEHGIDVVMTRTTNRVRISNRERALLGNRVRAALCVRIHFDSSKDHSVHGISTLYPADKQWGRPITEASLRAATLVERSVVAATGAKGHDPVPRSDMTGFNWSTRPTIIVECGFLSNIDEDRLIARDDYQTKITEGIANGILEFLHK